MCRDVFKTGPLTESGVRTTSVRAVGVIRLEMSRFDMYALESWVRSGAVGFQQSTYWAGVGAVVLDQ